MHGSYCVRYVLGYDGRVVLDCFFLLSFCLYFFCVDDIDMRCRFWECL